MMPAPPQLLAFDLDGVLYSSEPFLGEAYRQAIENVNRDRPGSFDRVPPTAEILQHIGWPVPIILSRLFPNAGAEALSRLAPRTLAAICERVAARRGILYEDVPTTLALLRDRPSTLVVASNGRRHYVETVLATYGIDHYFEPIVTADELGDKIGVVRSYVATYRPAAAVMIGDRASDVEAAHAAGMRFVGCDYGHGHRAEIAGAGPVVDRFADLPAAIDAVLAGR